MIYQTSPTLLSYLFLPPRRIFNMKKDTFVLLVSRNEDPTNKSISPVELRSILLGTSNVLYASKI
jgi:hypothetical protein